MLTFLSRLDSWVLYYCGALIVVFSWAAFWLEAQSRRVSRRIRHAAEEIGKTAHVGPKDEQLFGRSARVIDELRIKMAAKADEQSWWERVEHSLERYESPAGREGYFTSQPADDLISVDAISRGYNGAVFHAFPGVLTSLGLLGTFIAILVGLTGLRMNQGGTVLGLDTLISNLSGKFLTSIVALSLSVIFLGLDLLGAQRRLVAARQMLSDAVSRAIPYLSPTRILLDIQRQSVKQATSLSNISADVVDSFASVFRSDLGPMFASAISGSMATELHKDMGPLFTDLRGTMAELTGTVQRLEQTKQESMVGELRGLLDSLQRSLQETLGSMAHQFQAALSGSTKSEFGALADTIRGSATVVETMNANFSMLQQTLQGVVDEAKATTSNQMRTGAEQTERLNSLVEGLMVRLNDTASQNYQQLTGTLTSVVANLSEKVTELSEGLVRTVGSASASAQTAAAETMRQAGTWSAQTSQQMSDVLAMLQRQNHDFERAGETLVQAQGLLQTTLDQNARALGAMGQAAAEVKAYTQGLAGVQKQFVDGQQEQLRLTALSRESIAKLVEAASRQEQFLAQYDISLQNHQTAFAAVDREVGRILETILDRMHQYNRTVEQNFKAIVESANVVMPRMANVIKSSTDELKEHLDELNDVIGKGADRIATARRV